jgi:hypothetical protein
MMMVMFFPDYHSGVIPGRAEGAGPESITPVSDYGFRARRYAAPRNDDAVSIGRIPYRSADV